MFAAPGDFDIYAQERNLADEEALSRQEMDEYERVEGRQAERDAVELDKYAAEDKARADEAEAKGRKDRAEHLRKSASEQRKAASDRRKSVAEKADKARGQESARLGDKREEITARKKGRSRFARSWAKGKAGAVGLLGAAVGAAGGYLVNSFIRSQADAESESADNVDTQNARLIEKISDGQELTSDERRLLELSGYDVDSLVEGAREMGGAASELPEDPEIQEEVERDRKDNDELREDGYRPRGIDEEVDRELDAEEGQAGSPAAAQPFMAAAASEANPDSDPGIDPSVYRAIREEFGEQAALDYANRQLDLQYEAARSDALDEAGMGSLASRLEEGGDVIPDDSFLGRANEAVQSLNPNDFSSDDVEAEPGSVMDFAMRGAAPANSIAGPIMDLGFGVADLDTYANLPDDVARLGYKLGESSGLNDEVRNALGMPFEGEPTAEAGTAVANDQARVRQDYEEFNEEQQRPITGGLGVAPNGEVIIPDLSMVDQRGARGAPDPEQGEYIPALDQGGDGLSSDAMTVAPGGDFQAPSTEVSPELDEARTAPLEADETINPRGQIEPSSGDPSDGGLPMAAPTDEAPAAPALPPDYTAASEMPPAGSAAASEMPRSGAESSPEPGGAGAESSPEPAGAGVSSESPAVTPEASNPYSSSSIAENPQGTRGDFNGSRGMVEAGLDDDAVEAERQLNAINSFFRDNFDMDADQRRAAAQALIKGGAAMANTPGTFLQGFTAGGAAGLDAYLAEEGRQDEAEQQELENAMARQEFQAEQDARRQRAAITEMELQIKRQELKEAQGQYGPNSQEARLAALELEKAEAEAAEAKADAEMATREAEYGRSPYTRGENREIQERAAMIVKIKEAQGEEISYAQALAQAKAELNNRFYFPPSN
jgi:hypothetical protein